PSPRRISDSLLRGEAFASARLPLEKADQCPEDLLNRILWHAMKGAQEPYPSWAIPAHDDDWAGNSPMPLPVARAVRSSRCGSGARRERLWASAMVSSASMDR